MKYKHERTGVVLDLPFEVSSRLWKPVSATEAAPKPAAAKKPAAAPKARRKEK